MKIMTGQYNTVERRKEVADSAKKLRRKYLRYKEAEIVYSIQHKKLLELAGKAGALIRIDGYVNRSMLFSVMDFHLVDNKL